LVIVTEQAGLKFVILQSGIYVTTPAEAEKIEKEQQKRPRDGAAA